MIILHAEALEITKAMLHVPRKGKRDVTTIRYDTDLKQVILELDETLGPDNDVKLYCKFHGILNHKFYGYYKNTYKENGQERHFAMTQVTN